jgi:hypothetical protein
LVDLEFLAAALHALFGSGLYPIHVTGREITDNNMLRLLEKIEERILDPQTWGECADTVFWFTDYHF